MTFSPNVAIELQLARLLPTPVLLSAGLLALLLSLPGLALHLLAGVELLIGSTAEGFRLAPQTHVTLLCAILLAYGLAVTRWLQAGMATEGFIPASLLRRSRIAGAAGVGVGLILIVQTTIEIAIQEPGRNPWSAGELYVDLLALLLLYGIGRAIYFSVVSTDSRIYRNIPVDLWDMAPLFACCNQGLRRSLAWSIGISLVVVIMYFDPNPALQVDSVYVLGSVLMATLGTALLSLMLPLWTIRRRIQQQKKLITDDIDVRLRDLRRNAARGLLTLPGLEADLLARRQFIMAAPEWAVETLTLGKLGLYILIPAGSWLVGPVIRQIVNNVVIARLANSVIEQLPL